LLDTRIGRIARYDRYWKKEGYLQEPDLIPGHFYMVISTSTLEHLRSRADMDDLARLVTDDGCLGLHTLVRGEIPRDPDWFYLLPVHTVFHTNRGMAQLFNQWGFRSSLYVVDARLWVWFRKPLEQLLKGRPELASIPGWRVAEGFLAYWP
ncbi:MAG: methyltransferase domain-containing protein, partial [Candidatus Thiodiazotropha sp.]